MKQLLLHYNNTVKEATANYVSQLISVHQQNLKCLLKTVDQLVNPAPPCAAAESDTDCETFFSYFTDKVKSVKVYIPASATYSDVLH